MTKRPLDHPVVEPRWTPARLLLAAELITDNSFLPLRDQPTVCTVYRPILCCLLYVRLTYSYLCRGVLDCTSFG